MKLDRIAELYKECSTAITEKTQDIYQLILGAGDENADIMVIADMPTPEEDGEGTAFVGKAGIQLDLFLEKLGLTKEMVYATHLIKYHPYKVNERTGRVTKRQAKKEEIEVFLPYLQEEISMISPKLIITLGEMSFRAIMEEPKASLQEEHGKVQKKFICNRGYKIFPAFQLATMNNDQEKMTEVDLDLLNRLINYVEEESQPLVKNEETPIYNISPKKSVMKQEKATVNPESPKKTSKHKVLLVYGGDGYADDPTLIAMERISNVLIELSTSIFRLDLYKEDYNIQEVFEEIKTSHAVIIATTVEWIGIGAPLQRFLDLCWKFGNKKQFKNLYLLGVVMSRQGFERDAYNHLIKSWELLGGQEGSSILACFKKSIDLETNANLLIAIDKKTEEFYRIISQNRICLPTSIRDNRLMIEVPMIESPDKTGVELPAQKSGQDEATIPNYEVFVEKQKRDIDDITNFLKKKLGSKKNDVNLSELENLKNRFIGGDDSIKCKLLWQFVDQKGKNLVIEIKGKKIETSYGEVIDHSILVQSEYNVFIKIIEGKMTVQRAFMTGEIKAKGDFTILYKLDALFEFGN